MTMLASRHLAPSHLALSYTAFAIIAMTANIGVQDCIIRISASAVVLSVIVGTGVGLVVKYLLDKRYIFRFRPRDVVHEGGVFVLYACMGVFTTAIFWGFEFGFHYLFASKEMRYLGGVIGLVIGYYTKYQLDRRYVFRTVPA